LRWRTRFLLETDLEAQLPDPWLRRTLTGLVLAALLLLGFAVLRPFIVPVIWAGILCYVSWPLYQRVASAFGGSRAAAALIMTLALTAAVIVPMALLLMMLRSELAQLYRDFAPLLASGVQLPDSLLHLPLVGPIFQDFNERIQRDPHWLHDSLHGLVSSLSGNAAAVLGNLGRNAGKLFVTVVSMFFLYLDGDHIALKVSAMVREYLGERAQVYLQAMGQTVKAVLISLVLSALVQGILGGLAYWIAGVRAPVTAAAVTAMVALVPFAVVLVWAAIVIWLVALGKTFAATMLALWCLLVLSWVDYLVRSLFISSTTRAPFLIVLFGVLGGLAAFGLVGLFIGPVILGVLLAVWREWHSIRKPLDPP
jgi:predicted PurR-regulated permease PerM